MPRAPAPPLGGRKITVVRISKPSNHAQALLRILSRGDIDTYMADIMRECAAEGGSNSEGGDPVCPSG